MNRFGGKIPGAIEGKQITALEKDEIFKRFAALQLPKDARKQRPQAFRGNGIEHLSHVGVARGAFNAVDGVQVAFGALLVKIEEGWAFERKHGESRHESVRQRHRGIVTAVIRDVGEKASNEAEKRISRKMFTFFGCNKAHIDPQDNDIKAFNRFRQRQIVAWRFTKSQLRYWCRYWGARPSGNCCYESTSPVRRRILTMDTPGMFPARRSPLLLIRQGAKVRQSR